MSFICGLGISSIGMLVYLYMQKRHTGRTSDYPQQALVVIATTTVIRFIITCATLFLVFTKTDLSPTAVLFGFVTGQILFLMNQLTTVTKNDGK